MSSASNSDCILPVELTDRIIDHLHAERDSLSACARVHSTWTPTARVHLFRSIHFSTFRSWDQFMYAVNQSPIIGSYVQDITFGHYALRMAADDMKKSIPSVRTKSPLYRVESLSFYSSSFDHGQSPVSEYIRTQFLGVKHLAATDITAADWSVLHETVLLPRHRLESVAFTAITVRNGHASIHDLLKYSEVTIDDTVLQVMNVHATHARADHEQSRVRHLCLYTLQLPDFPALVALLRMAGQSLETLEVDISGRRGRFYPAGESSYVPLSILH
jgi:hypothetical protein